MKQLCRLIAPDWLKTSPGIINAFDGTFTKEEIKKYNAQGYNVYYYPNFPSNFENGDTVSGADINNFVYVFVDCDFKSGVYKEESQFLDKISAIGILPSRIVNSGNGIHAYWKMFDLEPESYLRFQRRLARLFDTDLAVGKICQLMRLEGTTNTKVKDKPKLCELIFESEEVYTCEELDKKLPKISIEDENFCKTHFDRTHNINQKVVSTKMPLKWSTLVKNNKEVNELWAGEVDDRSKADFRLAHIMFANEFTQDEAASVLVNSRKALERAPQHQFSYAWNIIDQIWTYEMNPSKAKISTSVRELLMGKNKNQLSGERIECHPCIDNTVHGFRRGQVLGLVGGTGIGKTSFALNMFKWFSTSNPELHHFFAPLEQPAGEIAERWKSMCGDDTSTFDRVHIISNHNEEGNYRNLSLEEIKTYIIEFKKENNIEVGCIVIDHIGVLKKKGANDEKQDITDICHAMKPFAIAINSLLIMQSQTSREKAGDGDLELGRDAAYGTMYFESYCDYLITLWQPLKRCYGLPNCPIVTAYKFCKIRHKKVNEDIIQEGRLYYLIFDPKTELLETMTQKDRGEFEYYLPQAISLRKLDKKTDAGTYLAPPIEYGVSNVDSKHH